MGEIVTEGRAPGARLIGKTWSIPADASRPARTGQRDDTPKTLWVFLKAEKASGRKGGIYHFEAIHPFQDGNGRIGRLLLFKECLKENIVPSIIDEELKLFYYSGLKEWPKERGYLLDTCFTAQDRFKWRLDYFRIPYGE